MESLLTLVDEPAADPTSLTPALAELYGGGLEVPDPGLYANFVSSLDGVVALGTGENPPGGAPAAIALHSEADRFVMGLLRALSDCVVVGAGTLRDAWNHRWTPGHIYPPAAADYAALGRSRPELVVVTLRGDLDPAQPALQEGALVLTTEGGAARLGASLPGAVTVRSLGAGRPSGASLREAVQAEGHRRLLTEGGPTLIGAFLRDRVLDELFLTLSPVLAGRKAPDPGRLSLVEGLALAPDAFATARIRSVRRHGEHLFLRHRFA